ncbi:PaaI family thioesterase [Spirillospora sp. CA-294931]|uniref:PaaI family thioesterase n=1 Tax=Spirillospora sp. CA-294931 TaxID=3240042 RepID=UPI003D8A70CC
MTAARTAIEREARARRTLDDGENAALADLAARIRELNEAVVHTGVGADEVAEVSAAVAALTERLAAERRDHPPVGPVGPSGMARQLANPVSGPLSPIAPPVKITVDPDGTARTAFTLSAVYEGPPSFVHGGVSAMILDQLLGVASLSNGTPGLTATLDLRYSLPTPHSVPLTAEARVTRTDGRRSFGEGRIVGPDGRTTVRATAVFVRP